MNVLTEEEHSRLNTADLYAILQQLLLREEKINSKQEHLWVIGVAEDARLLFIDSVHRDTQALLDIEPMEVFSLALQKRARNIILCHNRPLSSYNGIHSAALLPIKDLTDRLLQVGRIVNVPVLDHLVIDSTNYLSFEVSSIMQDLRNSIKYVPNFELIQRIQEDAAEILRQRGKEAEQRLHAIKEALDKEKQAKNVAESKLQQAARLLKDQGVSVVTIVEVTGLSKDMIMSL